MSIKKSVLCVAPQKFRFFEVAAISQNRLFSAVISSGVHLFFLHLLSQLLVPGVRLTGH